MSPKIERYKEAREHLDQLLKASPEDGELEELVGRCLEAEAQSGKPGEVGTGDQDARSWYEKAIKHAPGRIDAYVRPRRLPSGPVP